MNDQSIRDRLLDMEKRTPELEKQFKKEVNKMFEKKLTISEKIGWSLSTLMGVFFVIIFSYAALVSQELPWLVRAGFIEGAVFGAAWAVLSIWILKKGSLNWLRDENMAYGLSFGFILLLMINMFFLGNQLEDKILAIQMMLNTAVFFMIFGIPALFNMRINRTEASLREQLLKIELKMAEMAEKIGHKI